METLVYREIHPGGVLAGRVECFWTLRGAAPRAAPRLNRVLPDGCMDLIFNLGDPPLPQTGPHHAWSGYVVGAMLRPAEVWHVGRVDLLGVRFRPGAAAAWVPVPAGQLVDRVLPLPELWRGAAEELEARLREAEEGERVAVLRRALERRATAGPLPAPPLARALELIGRTHGRVTVGELERAAGVSRRHLERLFAERVGVSPKAACRVARFRRALHLLRDHAAPSWSRLALESGYYDQAHLIRDFRALSGLTPAAFHAESRRVASVQYERPSGV